jgi:hypothetical protein
MKVFRLAIVDRLVQSDTVNVTQRAYVKPADFYSLPYTSAYRESHILFLAGEYLCRGTASRRFREILRLGASTILSDTTEI